MSDIAPISPSPVVQTVQKIKRDTRRDGQLKQQKHPRSDVVIDEDTEEDLPKHIDERV